MRDPEGPNSYKNPTSQCIMFGRVALRLACSVNAALRCGGMATQAVIRDRAPSSTKATPPTNFGAPPRLRLMENGFSYAEASIIASCLDRSKDNGESYADGWEQAHQELQAHRCQSPSQTASSTAKER